MLKLMIVDDEPFVRNALRTGVVWEKYGYEVVATCQDGQEALDMMPSMQPDIILTDVRMPFMNGMELAEKMHERYPEIIVIMISGYEEFEYAKAAVNYGAFAYLLKPLDIEELLKTLERAEKQIRDRKRLKEWKVTDGSVIEDILRGTFRSEKYEENRELLEAMEGLYYSVVIANIPENEMIKAVKKELLTQSFMKFSLCIPNISRNLLYVLKCRKPEQLEARREDFCLNLWQIIKKSGITGFCITASRIGKGLEELLSLYYEAEETGKLRYLIEDDSVYYADRSYAVRCQDMKQEVNELVLVAVKKKREEIYQTMNRVFEQFGLENVSLYEQKDYAKAVMYELKRQVHSVSFDEKIGGYVTRLYFSTDKVEIKELLRNYLEEYLNYFTKNSDLTIQAVIIMAKEYMEKNFRNPELSLSEIAEYVHLNPSYFSAVFSRYNAVTFVNYLNQLRMQHAIDRLIYTEQKISQIALESGYSNFTYFCRNFKKITGVQPKEYREKYKKI